MRQLRNLFFLSLSIGTSIGLMGATETVGIATGSTAFLVNHANVPGSATVFDGSIIEAKKSATKIVMQDGTRLDLDVESSARVYEGHAALETGTARISASKAYRFDVRGLRVSPSAPGTVVLVSLSEANGVGVKVSSGSAEIRNSADTLIAYANTGHELTLYPGLADPSIVKVVGVLEIRDGKYYLTDETTHTTMELQGESIISEAGHKVSVEGTITGNGAQGSSVVHVKSIKRLPNNVAKAGSSTSGTVGSSSSTSSTSTAATIAGVSVKTVAIASGAAAGASVGGLAITGSLPGQGGNGRASSSR